VLGAVSLPVGGGFSPTGEIVKKKSYSKVLKKIVENVIIAVIHMVENMHTRFQLHWRIQN
jgi:hypothetical protein